MKALPMLDHVMLWVARFFVTCLLLFAAFWIYWSLHRWGTTHLHFGRVVPLLIAGLLWIIGLSHLHRPAVRLCLSLSASAFLLRQVYLATQVFLDIPHITEPSPHFRMFILLGQGIVLLGYASIIWVASRPLQNSTPPNPGSMPHYPLFKVS